MGDVTETTDTVIAGIHAAYWGGMTPKEIRDALGVPLNVVRSNRPDGYRWDAVSHLRSEGEPADGRP